MLTQADRIVRDQAIRRHRAQEHRQKREKPFHQGPGWTKVGSIFDMNRATFGRMLRAYSTDLYFGWNPMKNFGYGVWEVWQKPRMLTPVKQDVTFNGESVFILEYQPNDFEHHVFDLQFLTPRFIEKLREMDMWENKHLIKQADDRLETDNEKINKEEEDSIKYAVRHNKAAFKKLKALAQDGYNPLWFFSDKRQGDGDV